MTRKLSVITAVGVAALSVGAPAAFGAVHAGGEAAPVLAQPDPMIEDGFAQAVAQVSTAGYRDAHDRGSATNPVQSSVTGYRDAFERGSATNLAQSNVPEYRDSFERTAINSQLAKESTPLATNSNVSNYRDAFERGVPPQESVPVSVTAGRDIEWPQIGVGLGMGLLLALGLGLIMRTVHIRPFAH